MYMTIRLFNKIAANLNQPIYRWTARWPVHHVPAQDGKVLLDSGNKGGLFGMGASIGPCFNGSPVSIFHSIKIGAAGSRHLHRNMITKEYKFTHLSNPIVTSALIWAMTWKWHKDSVSVISATYSLNEFLGSKLG